MDKLNGTNDFSLQNVKMKAWLVHQELLDAASTNGVETLAVSDNIKQRGYYQMQSLNFL